MRRAATVDQPQPTRRRVARTRYTYLWVGRWLLDGSRSVPELIERLRAAADELRDMAAAGVTFAPRSVIENGTINLITEDATVAARFGFDDPDELAARRPSP